MWGMFWFVCHHLLGSCCSPASCHLLLRNVQSCSGCFFGSYRIEQSGTSSTAGVCRSQGCRDSCAAQSHSCAWASCSVWFQLLSDCAQGTMCLSSALVCGGAHSPKLHSWRVAASSRVLVRQQQQGLATLLPWEIPSGSGMSKHRVLLHC